MTAKSKILIDARWLRAGRRGIGVFTKSLLIAITNAMPPTLEIHVAVPSDQVKKFKDEFGDIYSVIEIPPLPDPILDFIYFSYLLFKHNFDVVHFTGNAGFLFFRPETKVLLTVHDVSFMKSTKLVPWPNRIKQVIGRVYRKIAVPICARQADKIVTVSNFAAADLKTELGLEVAPDFVYHGIDDFGILEKSTLKRGIQDFVKNCYLVIGGADPQKNIASVVIGFCNLYRMYGDSAPIVSIVGLGERDYLKGRTDLFISPNIRFFGYLNHEEVKFAIDSSKCVIVPSFYESFGLPVIEALFANKRLICSDRGALREIGKDVPLYFDPFSIDSLIEAIVTNERLMSRDNYLKDWLAEAQDRFSWEKCAQVYLECYCDLVKKCSFKHLS